MNKHVVLSGIGSAKDHVFNEIQTAYPTEYHYVPNGFQVVQRAIGRNVGTYSQEEMTEYLDMVSQFYQASENIAGAQDRSVLQNGSLVDVLALAYGMVDTEKLEPLVKLLQYKQRYYRIVNLPKDQLVIEVHNIQELYADRVNERIKQLITYFNIPSLDFISKDVRHQIAYVLQSIGAVKKDRDIYNEQ